MQWPELIGGELIQRYKRFLADVRLADDSTLTVHCPNTGAMTGCAEPGFEVFLSLSDNPKRKYPHTWELAKNNLGHWICIHSAKANQLVKEAIESGVVVELQGYQQLKTEVKYGEENSRIDLHLSSDNGEQCFVEVKCVTLLHEPSTGLGIFPDAVSERGRKHLRELITVKQQGHRAVLFFCVQHTGIQQVAPADAIDAQYGDLFREAIAAGVQVIAYAAHIDAQSISLQQVLPVIPRQPL